MRGTHRKIHPIAHEEMLCEMPELQVVQDVPRAAKKNPVLELQLSMATNSINHEYARMEYDDTRDYERREELFHYMDNCREKYLEARAQLASLSPSTLGKFEADLVFQKETTLKQYRA